MSQIINKNLLRLLKELHSQTLYQLGEEDDRDDHKSYKLFDEIENTIKEAESIPIEKIDDVLLMGDKILTELKKSKSHITAQLNKDEHISYNAGFHTGFEHGYLLYRNKL